jgi:class 3 adenylate cyclase
MRLAQFGPPGEQARRRVAILFADITGFTALVESVEPETVYQIVRPLMDELVLLVRLYDGEIQQVLGDGFMSAFGLRSEEGDEADRAVRAGLALVATGSSGKHPPVHVGIEYGEVLVTPSWEPAGYGVWGRPVNLARRLCELAGPGSVQVGPGAYAHARPGAWSATPANVRLKGITDAVMAHSVTADPVQLPIPVTAGTGPRPVSVHT